MSIQWEIFLSSTPSGEQSSSTPRVIAKEQKDHIWDGSGGTLENNTSCISHIVPNVNCWGQRSIIYNHDPLIHNLLMIGVI